ncbi:hypothetical protein AGMMS49965_06380 [Bacteroidia bacterium]|nr:hypothetical protein AGMMS49965_06380 [Bacteroidia bacterium]
MHTEILSDTQKELLPLIAQFKRSFYLVGGTAIALQMGHRQSIDFDLFTLSKINRTRIKHTVSQMPYKSQILFEDVDQVHFIVNEVKLTFFNYLYPVEHPMVFDKTVSMPGLLSLAAMKAFALGRRTKWKDYVDLYFLLRDFFTLKEISDEAEKIFGDEFSEKLFRGQLAFHKDIDYTEPAVFLPGFEVGAEEVKTFLIDKSLQEIHCSAQKSTDFVHYK